MKDYYITFEGKILGIITAKNCDEVRERIEEVIKIEEIE